MLMWSALGPQDGTSVACWQARLSTCLLQLIPEFHAHAGLPTCRTKSMEDLQSTTRYVTWSLHTKSRSSLKNMLSKVTAPASGAGGSGGGKGAAGQGVGEGSAATADFLENTLWNRTLGAMSEEIVAALVCQIFEGAWGQEAHRTLLGHVALLLLWGIDGTASAAFPRALLVLLAPLQASATTLCSLWSSSSTASSLCPSLTPSRRGCGRSWRARTRRIWTRWAERKGIQMYAASGLALACVPERAGSNSFLNKQSCRCRGCSLCCRAKRFRAWLGARRQQPSTMVAAPLPLHRCLTLQRCARRWSSG